MKSELASPLQKKRAMALLRRSFYSAGPVNRSRNLTKSLQIADRIAGRVTTSRLSLSQTLDNSAQFMSPEKDSSFMFSQLMGSPTPTKGTPKKSDRTPLKSPINSPSSNTRSKFLRLSKTPNRGSLIPDSPSCHKRLRSGMDNTPKKWSPSDSKLMSPPSARWHSPRGGHASIGRPKALFSGSNTSIPKPKNLFAESPANKKGSASKHSAVGVDDCLKETPEKTIKERLMSPNIKKASTPKSSRAKMFLFKSPEHANTVKSPRTPISRGRCRNLSLLPDVSAPVTTDTENQTEGERSAESLKSMDNPAVNKKLVPDVTPPHQRVGPLHTCATDKTPSPCKHSAVIKTPNSLDNWPRKKKGSSVKCLKTNFKLQVDENCKKNENKSEKTLDSKDVEYKEQLSQNVISDISELSSPRRRTKKPSGNAHPASVCEQMDVENDQIFTKLSQESTAIPHSSMAFSSPSTKKRSLALSPDSVSSPSKRRCEAGVSTALSPLCKQQSGSDFPSGRKLRNLQSGGIQKDMPMSYSLHSRILSRNLSMNSNGSAMSQGFDTVNLSQQSNMSQTSVNSSLSQTSDNTEYFCTSNDEVFISELSASQSSVQDNKRSESPVFGSSHKRKIHCGAPDKTKSVPDSKLIAPSFDNGFVPLTTSSVTSESQQTLEIKSPKSITVSPSTSITTRSRLTSPPSGKKYSPSVSAKSLMHLMNSPLITSPGSETENCSPSIMRDVSSRNRPRGRSKRSLNMCH